MPVFPSHASPSGETFPQYRPPCDGWHCHLRSDCLNEASFTAQGPDYRMAKKSNVFEYVEPIGARVLVRKDEPKRETRGGIALPDAAEIPTITGRIVTISVEIENDDDVPLRQYDKILFHPKNAIPVDLEHDNQLFVVPVEDVVAVFRRGKPGDPVEE